MFLSSKKYDPGCSSRIPDPDADFLPSRIQGSKKHPIPDPDPQHCSRQYNTVLDNLVSFPWRLCVLRERKEVRDFFSFYNVPLILIQLRWLKAWAVPEWVAACRRPWRWGRWRWRGRGRWWSQWRLCSRWRSSPPYNKKNLLLLSQHSPKQ